MLILLVILALEQESLIILTSEIDTLSSLVMVLMMLMLEILYVCIVSFELIGDKLSETINDCYVDIEVTRWRAGSVAVEWTTKTGRPRAMILVKMMQIAEKDT